jgi:hypothetical protein
MGHLDIPTKTNDLKEEIKQATDATKSPISENDPKLKKEYPFEFKWTDSRGKVWVGDFVNRILSIGDREKVGIMRARLAGGQPYDSLDPLTQELNLMISHLTFSLDEEKRPDWAKDLREMVDIRVLQALYGEVLKHESTFFGW